MKFSPASEPQLAYSSVGGSITALGRDVRPINMWAMFLLSILLHLLVVGLTALTIFILQFFGFKIPLFDPLVMKNRDIEFVLVENPSAQPRNKHTRLRADRATRSGGQKIPNKSIAEPQRAAGAKAPRSKPQPVSKPQPSRQNTAVARPTQRPTPKPITRPTPQPTPQKPTQPNKQVASQSPPAPKLPTPRPKSQNTPALPPNPMAPAIKMPSAPAPKTIATGPIVNIPGVGSNNGAKGSPGPSQIPGGVSGAPGQAGRPAGGSAGARSGSGGRSASDQSGSPGGGGGRPGVDAMPEPDFGPYIAELQRRIKRNWSPPSDDRDKRIVALFTISKDGRLLSVRIQNSSGVKVADDAAMMAIRASAPFRPLPPNFRGNDIDVQFIFDYNVYRGRSSGITYSQ